MTLIEVVAALMLIGASALILRAVIAADGILGPEADAERKNQSSSPDEAWRRAA